MTPSHSQSTKTRTDPVQPRADEPLPGKDSPQWADWSKAILAEAGYSQQPTAGHRWSVVHRDNQATMALVAEIEKGKFENKTTETPRVIHWISALDGRSYTLLEFIRLRRQPSTKQVADGLSK